MTRVVLLLLFAVALAPAAADAKPPKRYSVSVEAVHHVGWSFRDAHDGQECFAWDRGDGDEITRIKTRRAGRLNVLGDGERGATAFLVRTPETKATYERSSLVLRHSIPSRCTPCGPTSEYGECGPDTPDEQLNFTCGPKTAPAVGMITILDGRVTAHLGATWPVAEWDSPDPCPVAIGAPSKTTVNRDVPNVALPGAWKKILKLRRGREVTLTGDAFHDEKRADDCNKTVVTGYDECANTEARVTVRRLR